MGDDGTELSPESREKRHPAVERSISVATGGPDGPPDPRLQTIIAAWPTLDETAKGAILAMVTEAG